MITVLATSALILSRSPSGASDIVTDFTINESGVFSNGTFLQMPQANVSFHIENSPNYRHEVLVNSTCDFMILSNTTQNATLAFVYHDVYAMFGNGDSIWTNMTISVNEIEVNYTRYHWDDLLWGVNPFGIGTEGQEVEFAAFNLELEQHVPIYIRIESTAAGYVLANWLDIEYIFGSAKSFNGDTQQRIEATITENQPFYDSYYYPPDHLSVTKIGNTTTVGWEFNVSAMEFDEVRLSFYVNEYQSNLPTTTSTSTTSKTTTKSNQGNLSVALAAIGCLAVIVLAAVSAKVVGFEK
jgi:hypothetical protein